MNENATARAYVWFWPGHCSRPGRALLPEGCRMKVVDTENPAARAEPDGGTKLSIAEWGWG